MSSVTIPGHIVAWKDHATNERLTVRLNLPSGCGPSDIDAKISPGGREVVVNYLWPDAMMKLMILGETYTVNGTMLQYPKDHVKMTAFGHLFSPISIVGKSFIVLPADKTCASLVLLV